MQITALGIETRNHVLQSVLLWDGLHFFEYHLFQIFKVDESIGGMLGETQDDRVQYDIKSLLKLSGKILLLLDDGSHDFDHPDPPICRIHYFFHGHDRDLQLMVHDILHLHHEFFGLVPQTA